MKPLEQPLSAQAASLRLQPLALAMLTPDEQTLIQALFVEEKTERQYAEELGVYRNAVHVRKIRILNKLKKLLE